MRKEGKSPFEIDERMKEIEDKRILDAVLESVRFFQEKSLPSY